jgi:hypothetical protein
MAEKIPPGRPRYGTTVIATVEVTVVAEKLLVPGEVATTVIVTDP